jgi:hypothetical protein
VQFTGVGATAEERYRACEGGGDELRAGVYREAIHLVGAGAAAQGGAIIEKRHRCTARAECDSRRHAGESTTDHEHPNVRHVVPRISTTIATGNVRVARYCVQFRPFLYSREGN